MYAHIHLAYNFSSNMHRRHFIQKGGIISTLSLTGSTLYGKTQRASYQKLIKPKALKKGDTIGLITPSSSISRYNFEKTLQNLQMLGFNTKYSDNIRVKKGFLAGTDQQRLEDLHAMFRDDDVDGIICARGGYGAGRILSELDYDLIRNNPKVFVGYSDITALHMGIFTQAGVVSFHGPNGDSTYTDFSLQQYKSLLLEASDNYTISSQDALLHPVIPDDQKDLPQTPFPPTITIREGVAEGVLVGGNLTLISTLMGTPYELDFEDSIVFLEDIGESPYRIDRMLTQLILAGKLQKAKGIALGVFVDCEVEIEDPDFPDSLSLLEVIRDRTKDLNIPVVYLMPFGHISHNAILPYGIPAELNADDGSIRLIESAVN